MSDFIANPPTENILVVDDTPANLRLLVKLLTEKGYIIRPVTDGRLALAAAWAEPPDLVLLDIRMPDLDGYEVCKQLKADERTAGIPIIFISAINEVFDKVKAFSLGAVDYVTKPFQVEEVLARIEHQLIIQRLHKQLKQEIQERRKAEEEARAASQTKSIFVANISHELRTPLNAILGFTQVLSLNTELSTEQREYLTIIDHSAENLLELINDLLDLSKIEAGRMSLDESSFDLYAMLNNLEQLFQIKAQQKKLNLIFKVSSKVPQYVRTDVKKLRCCLINLLSNAIKFTDYGSVTLRLEVENKTLENILIAFEIEDTGAGIAPEEIKLLFNAFVQTKTGQQTAEGTGLGLSITKKFVELMGGNIEVSSHLGEGTVFKFAIKISEADSSHILVQSSQQIVSLELGQPEYRILVVDDIKENRLLLAKMLRRIGFLVKVAESGKDSIKIYEDWQPHLILMDTRMPIMNGIEATQQIRAIQQETSALNSIIIAHTASVLEKEKLALLALGFNDFVLKPCHEDVLLEKIAEHLGVRYCYEDEVISVFDSAKITNSYKVTSAFLLEELSQMPKDWLSKFYQAANTVEEESVLELIEIIPKSKIKLIEGLKELVNDFRFDLIVKLIDSNKLV